ncbi:putative phage protein (TIGR01671 family) [Arthrobacter sp. V1I9]|uniref:YopX family protein n=1 Tax=Arthrobacter sp. V1I9 TaxID=3042275 RepID=UPI0027914F01|nr:YopX family protein [Arthrobacter sp. V1I9]MDQ0868996.1 putative phage protein (TIGR01671 family) [Arthrobacter sp. V1I9]
MREIKFRAWDKSKSEWLGADAWFVRSHDSVLVVWPEVAKGMQVSVHMETLDSSRVALMEYTGRKDENGVDVYDGDIITLIDLASDYTEKVSREKFGAFVVEWSEHLSGWYPKSLNGYEPDETWWDTWEIKVIGNIYENPELLEAAS